MNWCEAFKELGDGKSVTRHAWGTGIHLELRRETPPLNLTDKEHNFEVPWIATWEDLMGNDWEVL